MATVPSPADPPLTERLERLALGCRILAAHGHDDKTLGHMSMRDPDGRGFWLKRPGISLGEVAHAADFSLFDFTGERLEGDGGRALEWPIHCEIYRARDEVAAVGHTHAFHATIFSACTAALPPITHEALHFGGDIPRHTACTGLIDTPALGQDLARSLGAAQVVLQQNHGITVVGTSVEKAVINGLMIEKACHQFFVLSQSGLDWTEPPAHEIEARTAPMPDRLAESFFDYYARQL